MGDSALFAVTAYSQRQESSGKHSETDGEGRRRGDKRVELKSLGGGDWEESTRGIMEVMGEGCATKS